MFEIWLSITNFMDSMLGFVIGIALRLLHICYQVSMKLRKVEARCGPDYSWSGISLTSKASTPEIRNANCEGLS